MSVSLRPSSSLGFHRPLTRLVKQTLTVTNNNEEPVAFKVKTTAPKLYCVRPNSGRVEPGESVEVQVLLQAMKEEPPTSAKCKDKFLIQSTIITASKESMSLHDLWSNIDSEETKVHQQKIKVVYLPPVGQELPEEDENMSSFIDNSGRFETIRGAPGSPGLPANGHADVSFPTEPQPPLERAFSPAVGDYSVPEELAEDILQPQIARSITPIPPASVPPVPQPSSNGEDLRSQLAAAQAEIARLRDLLETIPEPSSDSGLRRRRVLSDTATAVSDGGETDAGTVFDSATVQPEGVPPQMVVGISLVVFVLTYLFF